MGKSSHKLLVKFTGDSNTAHCEGPGGHPTLFWEVATGLGGVVGKKGAGDGGFHIQIYFSFINRGNSLHQPQTIAHKINKHKSHSPRTHSATFN